MMSDITACKNVQYDFYSKIIFLITKSIQNHIKRMIVFIVFKRFYFDKECIT
ncbi:hypothetical protein CHRYSEO8AT_470151 [Chryseobacterium sp. 8AT]|nr:hypothetical protein CHRYSEO8AT_470151 [Chryseobacterium sp. 8AT]